MTPLRRFVKENIAGPALAVYRYRVSKGETQKLRNLPHSFAEEHLADCKAYPTREAMLATFPKFGTAAEVGVAKGDFSTKILEISEPERLYLIDYWKEGRHAHGRAPFAGHNPKAPNESEYDVVKRKFAEDISADRVHLIRDWSWDGLASLPDNSLDWVYIDAGHDYDSVAKDLAAVVPKLKEDGILAGHDFVRWGRFGYRCGVIEAVTEFCIKHKFKMVGLTFERQYPPSYALQRR